MTDPIPVKTTEKTFGIVEAILDREGARFVELQEDLGMPKSTLHDHLSTLEALGLVVKRGDQYHASSRFLDLATQVQRQRRIYRAATDEVAKLATETGEHASLMVEEDGEGVLVDVKKGEDAVDINAYPGRRLPLTPHAPGKAIMAHLPSDRVEEILDESGLQQYTDRTITDREEFYAELDRVREQGYAVDDEELIDGIKALSVPVRTGGEVWGAITVGGPTNRMRPGRIENALLTRLTESVNVVELNLSVRE